MLFTGFAQLHTDHKCVQYLYMFVNLNTCTAPIALLCVWVHQIVCWCIFYSDDQTLWAIRSIWSILSGSVTHLLSHPSTFWDKLVSGDIACKIILRPRVRAATKVKSQRIQLVTFPICSKQRNMSAFHLFCRLVCLTA